MLSAYVHIMTCCTMMVCWSWISSDTDIEDQGHSGSEEVRRWLDIEDADKNDTNTFFYFHCSLWVWSHVSGWGGNWSPHSPVTTGWTYVNQIIGVFMYMYLFGEIVSILQNFDLVAAEFGAKRSRILTFLQVRQYCFGAAPGGSHLSDARDNLSLPYIEPIGATARTHARTHMHTGRPVKFLTNYSNASATISMKCGS